MDLACFSDWCVGTRELASIEESVDFDGFDHLSTDGRFPAVSALCFDSHDALDRMTGFA